jgi:hypothetical protein
VRCWMSDAPFSRRRTQRLPSLSLRRQGFLGWTGADDVDAFGSIRWAKRLFNPGLRRMDGKESGTGPLSCVGDRIELALLAFVLSGE